MIKALYTFIACFIAYNVSAQTYSGIITHTNYYLTIKPFDAGYDDGTSAKLFYDGNNRRITFWNSDQPYTNLLVGNITSEGKLQVMGSTDTRSGLITTFGNLSSSDLVTSNTYRSFSGSSYTDGTGGAISRYFSYRSIYGGYLNYNNGGYGFYSQGSYPRMFFEVTSGNHGNFSNLPTDSPIKNGFLYQQIKGPSAAALSQPVKATKDNSQWLWGIKSNGNLVVASTIESTEVRVTVDAGADYVFEPDYDLQPLKELNKYLQENKHLPDVPSASEMEEKGISLSKMNILLLKKIEELTLYTIDQEKQLQDQSQKIKQQDELINELIKRVKALEN